jgi:rhomboid-like protein
VRRELYAPRGLWTQQPPAPSRAAPLRCRGVVERASAELAVSRVVPSRGPRRALGSGWWQRVGQSGSGEGRGAQGGDEGAGRQRQRQRQGQHQQQQQRRRIFTRESFLGDDDSEKSVITNIIILNFIGFIAWNTSYSAALPERRAWAAKHLATSRANLEDGRIYTLLTFPWLHDGLFHILTNIMGIATFGPPLLAILTPREFVAFYVVANIVSALSHAAFAPQRKVLIQQTDPLHGVSRIFTASSSNSPVIGASGAVYALGAFFALRFPRVPILLFGVVPVSAGILVASLVALDLLAVRERTQDGVAHYAHVGGAAFGALAFFASRGRIARL